MQAIDETKFSPLAIEFLDVEKAYALPKGSSFSALKKLSLSIRKGEFFGLLGHNGAGKTTAINILSGVTKATGGSARVLGFDIEKESSVTKRLLGVVPQEIVADSFFSLTQMLNIQSKLSGVVPDREWMNFLLEKLALSEHRSKTSRELSGGMKRRMMIARALIHKPQVLVLDEPTAGVDVGLRHQMWEFIQELNQLGITIVLTTHYLEEAEQFCDRIAILSAGQLLTLKENKELMELGGKPKVIFFLEHSNIPAKFAVEGQNQEFKEALTRHGLQVQMKKSSLGLYEEFRLECSFDESSPQTLPAACAKLQAMATEFGLQPLEMQVKKPNLEEVFLKLTNHSSSQS
jgi:ABC-2 type transport system ATP-binding protein